MNLEVQESILSKNGNIPAKSANRIPLVSIIVPAFNASAYIENCVKSALSQTYENVEVVVVDDGSHDDTYSRAKRVSQEDSRCKVISQANRGLSGARNAGLDEATGELVFFLDADDYIASDEIEHLVEAMHSHHADMAIGGLVYADLDGGIAREIRADPGLVDEYGFWHRAYIDSPCDYAEYVVACGKLFRKAVFLKERFDEGKLHEDEFIIHRIVMGRQRIVFADVASYIYVQRDESIMHSETAQSYLDAAEAFLNRARYFAEMGWWDLAFRALSNSKNHIAHAVSAHEDGRCDRRVRSSDLVKRWAEAYSFVRPHSSRTTKKTALGCALFRLLPRIYCNFYEMIFHE